MLTRLASCDLLSASKLSAYRSVKNQSYKNSDTADKNTTAVMDIAATDSTGAKPGSRLSDSATLRKDYAYKTVRENFDLAPLLTDRTQ